jgi:hypothetical protein
MAQALLLKRANASRLSGHWSEDDYDDGLPSRLRENCFSRSRSKAIDAR